VIDRSQDPAFGASVWQPLERQRESRGSKQCEGEPKECPKLFHASPEFQDFLLEFGCLQIRHVKAEHDRWCGAEPATGRRPRDAEVGGNGDVTGALDKISKPMIVPSLIASRSRHGMIIDR
jgi:hypothetical protein